MLFTIYSTVNYSGYPQTVFLWYVHYKKKQHSKVVTTATDCKNKSLTRGKLHS